jgi:hypothetical protein
LPWANSKAILAQIGHINGDHDVQGQWLTKIEGDFRGVLRVELEESGSALVGTAFLFYEIEHGLPGFCFELNVPKNESHSVQLVTTYLYPDGGLMTWDDRHKAEADLLKRFGRLLLPATFEASFSKIEDQLKVEWDLSPDQKGALLLEPDPKLS